MNYAESIRYLYGLGHEVLAAKLGLDSIRMLLDRLGNPERSFKSVLIAGTNGKGSVAAMLDSISRAAGRRTALYVSPHLIRIEERIRVDGEEISQQEFSRLSTEIRAASESLVEDKLLPAPPTFFEQVTAIAFSHFARSGPEIAVLEVGLGGRLDATNVADAVISVVTSIDFDHQAFLGNKIEDIAGEKAAIIASGRRTVIGRQRYAAAGEVLMRRCLEEQILPVFANEPSGLTLSDRGRATFDYESSRNTYRRIMLGPRGRHQTENAAAAIETCELLDEMRMPIPREAIIKGLREVNWPGRLELVDGSPPILLDGAHNPGGAKVLRAYIEECWRPPITLIFGAMDDKDIEGMASEIFPLATSLVLTRVNDPRAASTARLGKPALRTANNVIFAETVPQAVSWARSVTAPEGLICVAGSLHLVGAVKFALESEDWRPS